MSPTFRLHPRPEIVFAAWISSRPAAYGPRQNRVGFKVFLAKISPPQQPTSQRQTGLSLARHNNDHLTFGGGTHQCVASEPVRAQDRIAIDRFLREFPRIDRSSIWKASAARYEAFGANEVNAVAVQANQGGRSRPALVRE